MRQWRLWLRRALLKLESRLRPATAPPNPLSQVVRDLGIKLIEQQDLVDWQRQEFVEREHELYEARQMQGAGPWGAMAGTRDVRTGALRESFGGVGAQGAFGDLELALQNVEWRREVNLSWLEFSRWGIQQIILISRLYYIKNPIIRRLINIVAYYVMGRGIEISSTDEATNDAIKDYLEANKSMLGQVALAEMVRRSIHDGNEFVIFFPDTDSTGAAPCRNIDATEIQEIITNPEDSTEEWYFRRTYTIREFEAATGQTLTKTKEAWYPALGYYLSEPAEMAPTINGFEVQWKTPVFHKKYGTVGKWLFGCPPIYPALDWAKASRRYLEACATLAQSMAQFALKFTTKGGQQALAGFKQQMETTVGPQTQLLDQNPPTVPGGTFGSGPGTSLEAFHSRAQGLDPSEWKPFGAMACICLDVPPTWIGDLETANLATATSLDRPTELAMMERQESLREIVVTIMTFALNVQLRAAGGKLRESIGKTRDLSGLRIVEAPRKQIVESGKTFFRYLTEAERVKAKKPKKDSEIEITVTFPSIREGDIPQLSAAVVEAMTLGNKGGQIVGIDEKAGVTKLFELNGFENAKELAEEMYPSTGKNKYDPNRTIEDAAQIAAPIANKPPYSPGGPQAPGGHPQPVPKEPTPGQEALRRIYGTLDNVRKLIERKDAA